MNPCPDKKTDEMLREQMIEFITRTIREIDERKLRNIYHFILHIR